MSPLGIEDRRAKDEAIAEMSEELELARAELSQYRAILARFTPETQLRAVLELHGIHNEERERIVQSWKKLQSL